MKISFLGAAHEVTGSCTLLEVNGKRILVDCGMEQGMDLYENCKMPIPPTEIDCVLLTHAHIDHSGKLPRLVADGFHGRIYATYATYRLCDIMLRDSAHIQESEAEWRNRKAERSGAEPYEPLYTIQDAEDTLKRFESCDYDVVYNIFEDVSVRFTDAGHLLGSASVCVTYRENGGVQTIVFSGDLGNLARPLLRDPNAPSYADYVVIESTYGDRLHGPRPDYVKQLTRIIQQTLDRGGNIVIPAFAVGRTQELLYLIRQIKHEGLISGHDGFPVYVDSPLAIEATGIYGGDKQMRPYYDLDTLALVDRGINPIKFDDLRLAVSSEESKQINADDTPKVIISASGMCEAGRIRHHLKHNLWREQSTILFVGYQSENTLGRRLIDGADEVKLFGEPVQVRAHIEQLDGISGHADRDMLLDWLRRIKNQPKRVFVNHGDDVVCDAFATIVSSKLGLKAEAPYNGAVYDLASGECLDPGNSVRLKQARSAGGERADRVFARLTAAGKRLMAVIEASRGGANKSLARFADQINSLCDKWDK